MHRSPPPRPLGRTLVTGCTGFLGTWVTRELIARGTPVVGLVRARVPDSDFVRDRLDRHVAVVRGRVEDVGRLKQTLAIYAIDTVFHLAPVGLDAVTTAVRAVNPTAVVGVPAAAGLPDVFGPGDRRPDALVPRLLRGRHRPDDLTARFAFARDVARHLVDLAAGSADPAGPPTYAGVELLAAVRGQPCPDPLADAVRRTVGWCGRDARSPRGRLTAAA